MSCHNFSLYADNAVELYRSGKSIAFICKLYKCSPKTLSKHLNSIGIKTVTNWQENLFAKTGLSPSDLLSMYTGGMWKNEIAAKIGISEGTVGRYLSFLGVPIAKDRGEATKLVHERGGNARRAIVTRAAHDAVRGMKRTDESLIMRAKTLESIGRFGSCMERKLFDLLSEKGVSPIIQKSFFKYNIDIMVGNVAVEVTGRCRKPKDIPVIKEKIKLLLNSGYHVVWVWANKLFPVEHGAADYIVSLFNFVSANPAEVCKNRVIRRDGKLIAICGPDSEDFPGVFSAINGVLGKT
jgi:transposase